MKRLDYKTVLKFNAEEAVAALFWADNPTILINKDGKEADWLHRTETDQWKPLWRVIGYYPYTTFTYVDHNKETSETNFSIGDFNDRETRAMARLLREVWFGYVERKYHKSDNKTALKLENRLTGKIVYMGWYDGKFTVTESEPVFDSRFNNEMFEINEP